MSEQHKMTAEERIQLDDRVRRLAWTDRIAYFGVAVLMEQHAKAAVAEITRDLAKSRQQQQALALVEKIVSDVKHGLIQSETIATWIKMAQEAEREVQQ